MPIVRVTSSRDCGMLVMSLSACNFVSGKLSDGCDGNREEQRTTKLVLQHTYNVQYLVLGRTHGVVEKRELTVTLILSIE